MNTQEIDVREFIIKELLSVKCVKNEEYIKKYVDYCFSKQLKNKIKGKSSSHHILPIAKTLGLFKYKNLKIFKWNCSELTYYDHYYAHYLLAKALTHISTYTAFCGMHMQDVELDRIQSDNLIDEVEFNKMYSNRNKQISIYFNEEIVIDGIKTTRGKLRGLQRVGTMSDKNRKLLSDKSKGLNNPVYKIGVVDKIRATKLANDSDGISAERAALTMKQKFIDSHGVETSIYQQNGKKLSKTITTEFIKDGTVTTIAKERIKMNRYQMIRDGSWYRVKHIFDDTINFILPAIKIRSISAILEKKTIKNYLGQSKYGKTIFTESDRSHFIGLYVEKLESNPVLDNFQLDQILALQIV